MAQYDPDIIQTFAGKLYSKASSIEAAFLAIGATIGFAVGGVGGAVVLRAMSVAENLIGFGTMAASGGAAIVCALIGKELAQSRVFTLKLQAQQALCQVEIERGISELVEASRQGQHQIPAPPARQYG